LTFASSRTCQAAAQPQTRAPLLLLRCRCCTPSHQRCCLLSLRTHATAQHHHQLLLLLHGDYHYQTLHSTWTLTYHLLQLHR
jgi:hypothetical protein